MANRAVPLLTDRQAKLAKKTIAVGGVRGLILKVRATSLGNFSRIFQLRMTVDGKTRYLSIGPYPHWMKQDKLHYFGETKSPKVKIQDKKQ